VPVVTLRSDRPERLHALDALIGVWLTLIYVVYLTHADMWIAATAWLGWFEQPTRIFLMGALPLAAIWTACRLADRAGRIPRPGPLDMLEANRPVLLAFACLCAISLLPGAVLPGAVVDDGGTQLMVLPYAFVVFTFGLMFGGAVAVRRHWRRILLMTWLVTVTSVLVELFRPRTFSGLLPAVNADWATDADRPAGLMGDANTAAFIMLGLTLLILRYDRLRWPEVGLLAMTLLAVLATQSRGGLLLTAMVVAGYLYHCRAVIRGPALTAALLGGLAAVAGVVLVVLPLLANLAAFSDWEGQRRLEMLTFQGAFVERDESRLGLASSYLAAIEEAVWLGHGTGYMRTRPIGSHNMYLRQWVDNGVPGLLAYLALLGAGTLLFWQRRFPGGLMLILLATVQGLFSHTLLESRGLLLLYALALAVSVVDAGQRAPEAAATGAVGLLRPEPGLRSSTTSGATRRQSSPRLEAR
jgi:O-antigen ligase